MEDYWAVPELAGQPIQVIEDPFRIPTPPPPPVPISSPPPLLPAHENFEIVILAPDDSVRQNSNENQNQIQNPNPSQSRPGPSAGNLFRCPNAIANANEVDSRVFRDLGSNPGRAASQSQNINHGQGTSSGSSSSFSPRRCTRSSVVPGLLPPADSPQRKRRRCSNIGSGNGTGNGSGTGTGSGSRFSVTTTTTGRNSRGDNPPNGLSWQETMSSMAERIRHNFNSPDMSDITFLAGPDKVRIHAHKTLLCFCSPVFQAQFMGPMRSNSDTEEIPDIEADVFLNFLSFLYCGTFDEEMDVKQLLDLLYPAKKYLVPSLSERCASELIEKLKPENIFSVFQVADLFEEVQLKQQCVKYMERMSDKIVETEEFKNIDVRTLSIFLALDGLNSPESQLHRALLGWAEAECLRKEQGTTKETIRTILGPAMYMIRFPTMSAAEFSKEFPDSVLTDEESLTIYRQICSNPTWEPEISHFSKQKRHFSPTRYSVNRFDNETMEAHQVNFRNGHLYNLEIDFFTNKRIFMDGVSLFAVEKTHAASNPSLGFDIQLRVFGSNSSTYSEEFPCRNKNVRVDGDLTMRDVGVNSSIASSGSIRRGTEPHYYKLYLDEALEIAAGQKVIVQVSLIKKDAVQTNLNTFYGTTGGFHMPPDYKIFADCEGGRSVLFTFGNKINSELGVYSFGQIPEILFSL